MRALYLFLDRTTGVGRPLHDADETLTPIRPGAFAAWLASQDAGQQTWSGTARPNDDRVTDGRPADYGEEQAAGPSNVPAASRP